MSDSIIEYSLDGGTTWRHGKTVATWAVRDKLTRVAQRLAVRTQALAEHGSTGQVITRILDGDDPRAAINRPAPEADGERGGMGPGTAYRIVADAIPEEARGEDLDEALEVLYRLAEGALNASESL